MKKSRNPESRIKNQESSKQKAFQKILRFCAYQERSHKEVKNKLFGYRLRPGEADEILSQLITEGFLNEERFARAFAGGKFRIMKWGKLKIQHELEMNGLTPRCIALGLAEIDYSDYSKTIKHLIKRKIAQTNEEDVFKKKSKVARFVIGKGFEPELVWNVMANFIQ
jgi:regulatory protein